MQLLVHDFEHLLVLFRTFVELVVDGYEFGRPCLINLLGTDLLGYCWHNAL